MAPVGVIMYTYVCVSIVGLLASSLLIIIIHVNIPKAPTATAQQDTTRAHPIDAI